MGCLQETGRIAWSYRKTLILLLVPALSSPLLALHYGPAKGGWVVIVMAAYWITQALPLAVTSLLPIILFPLLGILDTDDVSRNYFKDTVVLFFGSMVMAVAIEERNVHKRIALATLLVMGSKPRWLMLGFMLSTAFLSMWISNTATTAMMVPIAHAIVIRLIKERKALASLHGPIETAHIITSETTSETGLENTDGSGDENKHGDENKVDNYFINKSYDKNYDGDISTANSRENDKEKKDFQKDDDEGIPVDNDDDDEVLNIESLSPAERDLAKGLLLCIAYSATIGGTTTLTGTGTTVAMTGIINEIYGDDPGITFANWFYFMLPATIISLFICWIWLQAFFLDRSCQAWFRDCGCCDKEKNNSKVVHELIKKEYKLLGNMTFAEGAIFVHFALLILLWLFRKSNFIPNFYGWTQIFMVPDYINDATVAMIIATSLFIFPSEMPWFIRHIFGKTGPDENPGPMEPLVTWKAAQAKLPWNIVLLLGGGFALANGCEASGLSEWMADVFTALDGIPPWALVLVLTIVLCLFTEVTSNVATTTIFLPICAALAESLCINPLYLMIPVTLACTYAYMLPAATPPNAIVFSFGAISVLDMVKAGVILNIVGIIVDNLLINSMGPLVYDVFTYPSWAPNNTCIG